MSICFIYIARMKTNTLYHSMSPATQQDDLFSQPLPWRKSMSDTEPEPTTADGFEYWKSLPGSRHVLRQVYRFASYYGERYKRTGRMVSVKLIWEQTRDHIKEVRKRAKAQGTDLRKWKGYILNNDFTPYVARQILEHRTDWNGMFELREMKGEL